MKALVQISDEVLGLGSHSWQLDLDEDRMTVRELIRSRIYQEVQDVNLRRRNQHQMFITLGGNHNAVQPSQAIGTIDWKCHFERAIESYQAGRFLLLVGEYQTESLDEVVTLAEGAQVTFLKLTPLVGG